MARHAMRKIVIVVITVCFIIGCGSQIPRTIIPDYGKKGIRLVALVPVINKTNDPRAAEILRNVIVEELYFKGYPKIPLELIDEKLGRIYGDDGVSADTIIPPHTIGEILGVDAVMYVTLVEWETSYAWIYAPTTVSASFELRSARTGETLWSTDYSVTKRNYDFTEKALAMKSPRACEHAIQEIVDKAMATLPNGPDFLGSPPKKKGFFGLW